MHLSDSGRGNDSISIDVFFGTGLLRQLTIIVALAHKAELPHASALSTSAILLAAAALEAVLSEAAYLRRKNLYGTSKFRQAGVPEKYEMLVGSDSAELEELWLVRNSISHSEPHNERSRFAGNRLSPSGAQWALDVVRATAMEAWAHSPPADLLEAINAALPCLIVKA